MLGGSIRHSTIMIIFLMEIIMNKEVKTADDLRALGWTDWYHPNYWVHPDLSDSSGKIDYTYLGMTLEQAIIYENSGKRK